MHSHRERSIRGIGRRNTGRAAGAGAFTGAAGGRSGCRGGRRRDSPSRPRSGGGRRRRREPAAGPAPMKAKPRGRLTMPGMPRPRIPPSRSGECSTTAGVMSPMPRTTMSAPSAFTPVLLCCAAPAARHRPSRPPSGHVCRSVAPRGDRPVNAGWPARAWRHDEGAEPMPRPFVTHPPGPVTTRPCLPTFLSAGATPAPRSVAVSVSRGETRYCEHLSAGCNREDCVPCLRYEANDHLSHDCRTTQKTPDAPERTTRAWPAGRWAAPSAADSPAWAVPGRMGAACPRCPAGRDPPGCRLHGHR